jgi:hypothetical protein
MHKKMEPYSICLALGVLSPGREHMLEACLKQQIKTLAHFPKKEFSQGVIL